MEKEATLRVAIVTRIIWCIVNGQENVNPVPESVEGFLGVGEGQCVPGRPVMR